MDKINKCLLLIKNNKFDEAKRVIKQSGLKIKQDIKFTLMGIIESEQSNYLNSIKFFQNALDLNPKNFSYNFNLGIALGKNLNTSQSIGHLKICIRNNYKIIDCLLDISKQLTNKNKLNLALKILLNYKQKNYQIFYNIAFIYNALNQLNLAKKYVLESLKNNSTNIDALFLYAEIFKKEFKYKESINIYQKIISSNPNYKLAYLNLANTFVQIDKYDEAKKNYEIFLKFDKENKDALFFLSQVLLKQNLCNSEVLQNFEERFSVKKLPVTILYNLNQKIWNGEFVDTLLIWGEQGVGDHIFYSKHLARASSYAKKIIFQTDKRLVNLFKNFFNKNNIKNIEIIHNEQIIDGYSRHIPIGSLMRILNIRPFDSKKFSKIIEADPILVNQFAKKIDTKNFKIGISWKSLNQDENFRNIDMQLILGYLKKIPNVKIYNLQFGLDEDEIKNINNSKDIIFYENIDYKNDFNSVAAIIENMDCVISIQNSTAHLSCSLQKKTFLLLPLGSRWYWGVNDYDQWYGCAKIFRQQEIFNWSNPLNELINSIQNEIRN